MHNDATMNRFGRIFLGLVLLAIGAWLLLFQLGLLGGFPWALGPTVLIVVGLAILLNKGRQAWPAGAWLIVLGLWLVVSLQGLFGLRFHNSWPLLLVGLGTIVLLRAFIPVETPSCETPSCETPSCETPSREPCCAPRPGAAPSGEPYRGA